MKKRNFTLVELLIVVGILGILAGLLIPAVIGAKQQGRVTQARADMSTIRTAFEAMNNQYGKMAAKNGSNYELGGESLGNATDGCVTLNGSTNGDTASDGYCKAIAELSDPGTKSFANVSNLSVNKRRIRFLDPRPEYDPSKSCTDADNKPHTWLDPWGNAYYIRINVDKSEEIPDPSGVKSKLSGRIVLWSAGPDGKYSATAGDADNKDNVPGWKDGNWLD